MANTTVLQKTEVVNGNVVQAWYTYVSVYGLFVGGWMDLPVKVHGQSDPSDPVLGQVTYKVQIKDVEHALFYHIHAIRGKRIRLYKAHVRDDGETVVDMRNCSIHSALGTVNGHIIPLHRHHTIPSGWYIYAKVDSYPDTILVKYYYEPTGAWHTVPLPSSCLLYTSPSPRDS